MLVHKQSIQINSTGLAFHSNIKPSREFYSKIVSYGTGNITKLIYTDKSLLAEHQVALLEEPKRHDQEIMLWNDNIKQIYSLWWKVCHLCDQSVAHPSYRRAHYSLFFPPSLASSFSFFPIQFLGLSGLLSSQSVCFAPPFIPFNGRNISTYGLKIICFPLFDASSFS